MPRLITTEQEALRKAWQLWGKNARVEERTVIKSASEFGQGESKKFKSYSVGVMIKVRSLFIQGSLLSWNIKGIGLSWDEAFENVAKKELGLEQ